MIERKIKVLFVSSWYPSRVNATLGNFVQKHAEAVSDLTEVSVLHVCFDKNLSQNNNEVVFNETEQLKTLHIYCKKTTNPVTRFKRYIKAYNQGLRMITEKFFDPDLVHVNVVFPVGLLFYFSKWYKKYPCVITEHFAGYLPIYPGKLNFLKKYLIRKIIKRSAFMLPVSQDLMSAMQNLGFSGNYKVIPNVVDTSVFKLLPKEKSETIRILHVSSLDDDQKNMTGILNVIEKLHNIRRDFALHIVSDGSQQMFIERARNASLLDTVVFFHGSKSTNEVAEIMQRSDFLLLFSNYENMPCVISEAWSCGLPVVTTDVGGIAEHCTPKHGILVKAKDEEGLLKALLQMIDGYQNYDRAFLHDYAVNNFSYEVIGKKISDIYMQTIIE
jgi:L-malate glycosyltransferase